MPDIEPLFVPDGDRMVPTEHTRGPWDPSAQHGGPPAALLARACEAVETSVPMAVARLTVELLRPVPLRPLTVSARVTRPGRRVQLVEAVLEADGTEVCRALALRLRERPVAVPEHAEPWPVHPGPDRGEHGGMRTDGPAFHSTGAELRFVRGTFEGRGPATVWIRLRRPVVADEEPSGLMRATAAADFGNGVSSELHWDRYLFVNPDLTVSLHRTPVGEWICLDAQTRVGPEGRGLAESALSDLQGPVGRSTQSLFVEPREGA